MLDFENYSFENILKRTLARVPENIDKREGSIIYDALAPACYELAEKYLNLQEVIKQSHAATATGEWLDLKVSEQGIKRFTSTHSIRKGIFTDEQDQPAYIPLGSRFSTINEDKSIIFEAISQYAANGQPVAGSYMLKAEKDGIAGNQYTGNLIPISFIPNLKTATITEIITPARDTETDEELRSRYFEKINAKSFGGNVAQYDQMLKEISGVGEVQIYPVWNGGGTVKVSVIDAEYNKVSTEFIQQLQTKIDPPLNSGQGLGLAPIGHKVTVTTPSEKMVNITATLVLTSGTQLSQVKPLVETAIGEYFKELKKSWGIPDNLNNYSLSVFLARVNYAILSVKGVSNVLNTRLNGGNTDIVLIQTAQNQEIPKLGTVVLNE